MEIYDLKKDEKITEPGFYRMSLDRHHHQPCDGPSVTSGVLRKMELRTPADVWAFHDWNDDRWEQKETDALKLGRAMASFIEGGPDMLAIEFAVLPEVSVRRPTAAQIDAYDAGEATAAGKKSVEFWRELEGMQTLTAAQYKTIENMGSVVRQDPAAMAVLGGEPEITMAYKDDETGLWVLARPDNTSFDGVLADYKKINTQGRAFDHGVCDARTTQHGYDMQMGLAGHAFKTLTGNEPSAVGLVFQWDEPPHHVILREISDSDLKIGQWRNQRALRRIRSALDSGYWAGPGDDTGVYKRPDWQRDQIFKQMAEDGLGQDEINAVIA
jgi:hypothetical protein